MRRDSIFYKLFQQQPSLIFQLLGNYPANADDYRFDSVAVKEPKFEIDGVFLPPEGKPGGVYFSEVQFQKDELLYERVFAESSLYFYRNSERFSDWQIVIIYPSRNIEQKNTYPHRSLLNGDQFHRVYLDELGDIRQLPIWVALMVLTTLEKSQAPEEARYLLTRTQQEIPTSSSEAIIEMITTIIAYKFENLTRREAEAMLGITFEETRLYQDIKEEARKQGIEQGIEQGTVNLVMRLLKKRLGEISPEIQNKISQLPLPVLENLSEALLDFTSFTDLENWLQEVKI
ncbi:MAG: Rpn family recombination-promoting nuclease/putative transposase [Sphaerospermopsis sp. SIO1G1]|nr:Rpn family recombination-promoting nuclease/putative transposase [Sphaerospermopsis sp. SIO1G1]